MNKETRGIRRQAKLVAWGALWGLLLLGLMAVPFLSVHYQAQVKQSVLQQNLKPARGDAFDSVSLVPVSLQVLASGSPRDGVSVSADGCRWYTPAADGTTQLLLRPGEYRLLAAADNCLVEASCTVGPEGGGPVLLDVGLAPVVPPLTLWDVPQGTIQEFQLDFAAAETVSTGELPAGLKVKKQGQAHVLVADAMRLEPGFYTMALTVENSYGKALARVAVRVTGDEPVREIYTVEDLQSVRQHRGGHYRLMNDLDMSNWHDWEPLCDEEYPFTGVFDGGGHEITGFHAPEEIPTGEYFCLIGWLRNAEFRNLIVRQPMVAPQVPPREDGAYFGSTVFFSNTNNSLIENCASIGGMVTPSDGGASTIAGGAGFSIIRGCFNSTRVASPMINHYLPNTGGLMGGATVSYVTHCANEAEVKGNHLSGGIMGYSNTSVIAHSINSGFVWGSTLVGEFPTGAIMQTTDCGGAAYCYFAQGTAASGGMVFAATGVINSLEAIEPKDLRNTGALPHLGCFNGPQPDWAFASMDALGPVPAGIFKEQVPPPVPVVSGERIQLPLLEKGCYLYTLDGSSPYGEGVCLAESLDIQLEKGQVLTVVAAKQGMRDSRIVAHGQEGS